MNVDETLKQRGQVHGVFAFNARCAQALKGAIRGYMTSKLSEDQWEAMDLICTKMSRILTGNPNYADHWHDIAGYAKLIEDRLTCESSERK